jgi:hypothetical protein
MHEEFVWITIPYVNRGFLATAVTKISDVVHNPGFCNGPWFVNPSFSFHEASFRRGRASVRGRREAAT